MKSLPRIRAGCLATWLPWMAVLHLHPESCLPSQPKPCCYQHCFTSPTVITVLCCAVLCCAQLCSAVLADALVGKAVHFDLSPFFLVDVAKPCSWLLCCPPFTPPTDTAADLLRETVCGTVSKLYHSGSSLVSNLHILTFICLYKYAVIVDVVDVACVGSRPATPLRLLLQLR